MMEKGKLKLNYLKNILLFFIINAIFRGGSGHYTSYAVDNKDGKFK